MQVDQKEIKEMGMNLYFSMLEREFMHFKSFKRVERQTIDTLDKIVNEYEEKDQKAFEQFFLLSLNQKFPNTPPEMQKQGQILIHDMKQV